MIDIKPPDEPFEVLDEVLREKETRGVYKDEAIDIAKELHTLNNTLKEILKEMRKRKT